jgi:hypothetical protein
MASTMSLRGDDVAEHALGQERRLAEESERHEHEACQHGQFELDDGDEELDRQHEEGEQHDQPAQQQHGDGHEVGEERGDADELPGLLQQRLRRGEPGRRDESRPHQVVGRESRSRGLEPEAGERLEHDVGEALEVADQEGKEADVEHLADQLRGDVVLAHQRPEQAGERDVDRHQHGGEERYVTRQQAEAGVDVAAEGLGEAVDDG